MSCKIVFAFVLVTAGIATAFGPHDESARRDDVVDEQGEREITPETEGNKSVPSTMSNEDYFTFICGQNLLNTVL